MKSTNIEKYQTYYKLHKTNKKYNKVYDLDFDCEIIIKNI